jgi:hypothetical protein
MTPRWRAASPHCGAQCASEVDHCAIARRLPHRRWARPKCVELHSFWVRPWVRAVLKPQTNMLEAGTVCGKTYTQPTEQAGGS